MLEKFSIILEIIAAGLLAIHFLIKRRKHTEIDQWLITRLKRKISPRGRLRKSVLVIAGVFTFCILGGIVIWGTTIDLANQKTPTSDVIISNMVLISGVVLGIISVVFIVWLHNKNTWLRQFDSIGFVYLISFILGLGLILTLVYLTSSGLILITSFIVSYAAGLLLMGLWIIIMPLARSYFTIRSGVLVRFGIIIFIVAKGIQFFLIK